MADDQTPLELRFRALGGRLSSCLSAFSDELRIRQSFPDRGASVFAPDTDVIFDFVNPSSKRRPREPVVRALLNSAAVKIPVLPGVLAELFSYCASLVSAMTPAESEPDLLAWLRSQLVPELGQELVPRDDQQLLTKLRDRLRYRYDNLVNARRLSDRLLEFLNAPNIVDIRDCGLPTTFSYGGPEQTDSIYRALMELPRSIGHVVPGGVPTRRTRDYRDSINIATVLAAHANGIHAPLVTGTHALYHVFQEFVVPRQPDAEGLVIDPRKALMRISLRDADDAHIRSVVEKVTVLLERTVQPATGLPLDPSAAAEIEEYLQTAFGLMEFSSLLRGSWAPPISDLPDDIDMHKLAVLALDLSQSLVQIVLKATRRLNFLAAGLEQVTTGRSGAPSGTVWKELQPSFEAIWEVAAQEPRIVIQKLIIVEKGATMSDYKISQTGTNLTAVVDSFKTTLASSSNNIEIEKHLQTFVDKIVSSDLEVGKKQEVVEAAKTVVETVKEQGRLSGTGALLWQGVRQAIGVIPGAVDAWEALKKLWS